MVALRYQRFCTVVLLSCYNYTITASLKAGYYTLIRLKLEVQILLSVKMTSGQDVDRLDISALDCQLN